LGFFLLWAGWCVLFFSLSRGKLPPYVLPAVPALAVVFGYYLDHLLSQTSLTGLFQESSSQLPWRAVKVLGGTWLVVGTFGWWKGLIPSPEYFVESGICVAGIVGVEVWGRRMSPQLGWLLCGLAITAVIHESAHELIPSWSYQRSPL